VATNVLATLAVIVGAWWGRSFMIPFAAGLMLALLLQPMVAMLERIVRSRIAASTLALMVALSALVLGAAAFGDQLARVVGRAPEMISLVAQQLAETDPRTDSLVRRARDAFQELDRAAERIAGTRPLIDAPRSRSTTSKATSAAVASSAPPPVSLSQTASVALRETAVSGSSAIMTFASDLTIILFLAFFVLTGGPALAARFLGLWDERPGGRRRAEQAARECVRQIRIYAGVLLVTNTVIGVAVWIGFAAAGLPDAAGWGVTAAVLHVVPYLGMALLTGLGAAEAFLAHGTLTATFGVAAFVVLLSTIVSTLVTAWLQGRAARMSAAAVFIGVVFWGALWGVWGLLLGPPLIVLIKVVAEHTDAGRRLARLLEG
jgi:predicted PurR-regulated permease PerM